MTLCQNLKLSFQEVQVSIEEVVMIYRVARFLINYPVFLSRQYLEIETQEKFPIITFDDLISNTFEVARVYAKQPALLGLFKKYLASGYYLFYRDNLSLRDFKST